MNYNETAPYVPGKVIVKLTDVPSRLRDNPELHKAFAAIFEVRAIRISDFYSAQALTREITEFTEMTRLIAKPEAGRILTVYLNEVKDKVISRTIKEVSALCLSGITLAALVNDGFTLVAYELSEDEEIVIDAWMLSAFTFPNGLEMTTDYVNRDLIPEHKLDKGIDESEYAFPLTGLLVSNEDTLRQAQKLHMFKLSEEGKDTARIRRELGWRPEPVEAEEPTEGKESDA